MIYDRCPRCRRRIPAGTKCSCIQEEKRIYPKKDSGDRYIAFYSSGRWQRCRAEVKAKYNNLDIYSLYILKTIEQSEIVHHIESLKSSWEKRYDINNLIPLTDRNHKHIHKLMEQGEDIESLLKRLKARYEQEFGTS